MGYKVMRETELSDERITGTIPGCDVLGGSFNRRNSCIDVASYSRPSGIPGLAGTSHPALRYLLPGLSW